MKRLMQRLLREPLVHFLGIGVLLFLVYAAMNDRVEITPTVIQIGPEKVAQIEAGFGTVWNRKPTADELAALIEEDVREEVYYREALALGLDRNDALVRRRLRLKMEFLIDSAASALDPTDAELESYFAANLQHYLQEPRLAFEQIFLGKNPTPEATAKLLANLRDSPNQDPLTLGSRSLLPAQLGLSLQQAVDGTFGKGFYDALTDLPLDQWSGPVTSSYGLHLVRVLDYLPARPPALAEVRDTVQRDWKADKTREIHDRDYAERRKRFVVEIDLGDGAEAVKR